MKLKYSFEFIDMDEEVIAVPVGRGAAQMQGVLKLNKEGREIVELLNNETTLDALVETISRKYDNNKEELLKYVHNTITTLEKLNLIEG